MKIYYRNRLLYTSVILSYRGKQIKLDDIIIDTGSATTLFDVDEVLPLGMKIAVY